MTWVPVRPGHYLLDHPPARSQYRAGRRAKPTGCIVLHTAESTLDLMNGDSGAENVAHFISTRTDAGSYHLIGDRDSIVPMTPFSYEAFHDGTGSNPWSIGISLAMRAADWPGLDTDVRDQLVDVTAQMATLAASWLEHVHGIDVPARRITKAQSDAGMAGFIPHADRDPRRRSDPGPGFPWAQFLARYAARHGLTTTQGDPTMPDRTEQVRRLQTYLRDADEPINLGDTGPAGDGVDGDPGDKTVDGAIWLLDDRLARLEAAAGEIVRLQEKVNGLQQDLAGCETDLDAELGRDLRDLIARATS